MKNNRNKKSFITQIMHLYKPFRKYIFIVVFVNILGQLTGTLSPYLFGKSIDAVTHKNIHLTFYFLMGAFLLSIFQLIFLSWYRENLEIKKLGINIEKFLSIFSVNRMLQFSIGQHINEHSGVKQSIVNKGQSSLNQLIEATLYNMLPSIIQILVTLIILTIFDWRIALTAVIFVFIYIYLTVERNKKYYPRIDEVRKKHQAQSKVQSELFRNSTLIISEAQEHPVVENFNNFWNQVINSEIKTWTDYLKSFYPQRLFIIVGQYSCLGLGIYFILTGQHSIGMIVTLISWMNFIFGNLLNIMSTQRRMLFQIVEIKKYFDLLEIEPDIDSNPNGKTIENLQGKIEFKNVDFAYPYRKSKEQEENEEVIDKENKEDHTVSGINLVIPAGAKVGFVGMSGSGKTTIVNLMRRYYETTNGEILIDDVNLKDLNLKWFRSHIGNVEQKIDLFDRSIRDNILFGFSENQKNIDDEKLNKAVEDASLTDFILKLKDHGLDTVIGESGVKVSGGERQRIGIARALIKDPKILIFDEATSALDSYNEKLIHEAINRGAKGRTTIIIAHRLSTIIDADKVFVVADGKIVGEGKHEELSKTCEEYKELLKHQIVN
ncbi:ABC transporter ATP-binding protein/permease [Candidatus Nomurabacteria bacterium]|nr:ABC transporter ATP-binding protein/permease [Candidatus Nomurabacteria bacterium]